MPLNLIDIVAPFATTETEQETILVRGFASTELIDRSGDMVDPKEFDVATFLATSGQLLLDHDFIKTADGNSVSAGNVKIAVPSYIANENPSNAKEWVINSIDGDEFVSTFEKNMVPRMTVGDRGLFIVAEVKNEFAKELVRDEKLSAFSWRGFSYHQESKNGVTQLKAIDLIEISLVHMPDNATSTFTVVDENDPSLNVEMHLKDCDIYKIQFKKENYNYDDIQNYTKKFGMESGEISENDDSYFIQFGEAKVEVQKSFAIQVGDRQLIAAPKMKKKISEVSHVGDLQSKPISKEIVMDNQPETDAVESKVEAQKLFLLDIELVQSQFPGAAIQLQKNAVIDDVPVEIHTLELPVDAPVIETVVEVEAEVVETEAVEVETVEEVVAQVTEEATEEVVTETELTEVQQLTLAVANLTGLFAAKEAAEAQAKEEAEVVKAAAELEAQTKEEAVAELQKQLAEVEETARLQDESRQKIEKQLAAFGNAIPTQEVRTEKVETEKSVAQPETNCMTYFGQIKEKN